MEEAKDYFQYYTQGMRNYFALGYFNDPENVPAGDNDLALLNFAQAKQPHLITKNSVAQYMNNFPKEYKSMMELCLNSFLGNLSSLSSEPFTSDEWFNLNVQSYLVIHFMIFFKKLFKAKGKVNRDTESFYKSLMESYYQWLLKDFKRLFPSFLNLVMHNKLFDSGNFPFPLFLLNIAHYPLIFKKNNLKKYHYHAFSLVFEDLPSSMEEWNRHIMLILFFFDISMKEENQKDWVKYCTDLAELEFTEEQLTEIIKTKLKEEKKEKSKKRKKVTKKTLFLLKAIKKHLFKKVFAKVKAFRRQIALVSGIITQKSINTKGEESKESTSAKDSLKGKPQSTPQPSSQIPPSKILSNEELTQKILQLENLSAQVKHLEEDRTGKDRAIKLLEHDKALKDRAIKLLEDDKALKDISIRNLSQTVKQLNEDKAIKDEKIQQLQIADVLINKKLNGIQLREHLKRCIFYFGDMFGLYGYNKIILDQIIGEIQLQPWSDEIKNRSIEFITDSKFFLLQMNELSHKFQGKFAMTALKNALSFIDDQKSKAFEFTLSEFATVNSFQYYFYYGDYKTNEMSDDFYLKYQVN